MATKNASRVPRLSDASNVVLLRLKPVVRRGNNATKMGETAVETREPRIIQFGNSNAELILDRQHEVEIVD